MPELRDALEHRRRAVLQAEPGAGKTTVVPLRLLDEPWLAGRRILMLEPRRLAARAAARRLASLLGEQVGDTIGLVTRDERRVGKATRVEVVTEGILTRRMQHDPELRGVGLVIFDEFHERSLQADTGLALCLDAATALDLDLGILVMSATIDTKKVAALIGDPAAPIITSEGRLHPIELVWRPRNKKDWIEPATADAVRWALGSTNSGDVLVFLPGVAEIARTGDALRSAREAPEMANVDIRPLHGSLPPAEQDAAIEPGIPGRRKVVLSTDIAETSLTVEGVTIVVDAGLARRPQFDTRTGMTRLVTVSTSRASSDQRAGRAGRLEPGMCVRLWSKIEHGTRQAFDVPEILQVDLADLILELAAWGVTEPEELRFLDQPPTKAIREGHELLQLLGAIDDDRRLTDSGRAMVKLPLHPRLSRMVVGANEVGQGWLACLLAAMVDERDVLRGRPSELPADVALRLDLLGDSGRRHPQAAGRALANARDRARDLARRIDAKPGRFDPTEAGGLLALAYPDRIGQRRSKGRGRFRLRTGSGAWVADTDPLAGEDLIVAVDLDGNRKDARIRLGAPLHGDDLYLNFSDQIDITSGLVWDKSRRDLTLRTRRLLGSLDLGTVDDRPVAGPDTTAALIEQVRSSRLKMVTWTDGARTLQARVAFIRERRGDAWPDFSDKHLLATLEDWLVPFMPGATGRADVEVVSIVSALESQLEYEQRRALDRLTPRKVAIPSGRQVAIDYTAGVPVIRARVQEFYGSNVTPSVLDGEQPLQLELLSPAQRPIQVTSDLAGFWSGSWSEVRKEMAGRYPKHDWPIDPSV